MKRYTVRMEATYPYEWEQLQKSLHPIVSAHTASRSYLSRLTRINNLMSSHITRDAWTKTPTHKEPSSPLKWTSRLAPPYATGALAGLGFVFLEREALQDATLASGAFSASHICCGPAFWGMAAMSTAFGHTFYKQQPEQAWAREHYMKMDEELHRLATTVPRQMKEQYETQGFLQMPHGKQQKSKKKN
eukprot:TRINITY_DN11664_c0_g1_i1.p1 TRINITY_DN11664_c0_g1~~TRINITY_DN11664_c0_g1_i1.p1  ORF type:complete len:221 (-),score=61.86 TRINITY_DN11664_c0_g1_i1:25-591(-)